MIVNFKGITGTLLKTSGSMGVPKTIFHSLDQHVLSAQAVIKNTQLDASSCSLVSLPIHHIGGLAIVVRAWASGGRWMVPEKGWTVDWAVNQAGVTHMSLVSTQLRRFMHDPVSLKALRKLKAILLGGSAISKALIEQAYRAELSIITTYGSTETCSQVTATRLGDGLDRLLTSGRCLPDREVSISHHGEIMIKSDLVGIALSCWEREILASQNRERVYASGDFGYFDSQGYLHVIGRIDNRFISGGENIYPEEIERALLEHPEIESAMVVAKHDDEYGQRPVAVIKMLPGFELKHEVLQGFLRERIERFKIPKDWRPWPFDMPEGLKLNRSFFAKLIN